MTRQSEVHWFAQVPAAKSCVMSINRQKRCLGNMHEPIVFSTVLVVVWGSAISRPCRAERDMRAWLPVLPCCELKRFLQQWLYTWALSPKRPRFRVPALC